jgi:hypothetical protein
MRLACVVLVLALPAVGCEGEEAKPQSGYGPAKLLCKLAEHDLTESSGVAASRTNPGVFWTHNDSGDEARLYAFNDKGASLGAFDLEGGHRDWEDMCTFVRDGKGYLVVADTGDNAKARGVYVLYIYEEPKMSAAGGDKPGTPKLVETVVFTYGDGRSHDGESIGADPDGRVLYMVTRNRNGTECKAFKIERYEDAEKRKLKKKVVAEEMAVLQYRNVSAMDVSPDGLRMLVQTYGDAYEFTRKPDETWKAALGRAPAEISLPRRYKGEGATYVPDGKSFYLTTEGRNCPLYLVAPKP